MHCICCGKFAAITHGRDGVFFITHGGNDLFTPQGSSYLEIYVCDMCLLNAAANEHVTHATVSDDAVTFDVWGGEESTRH